MSCSLCRLPFTVSSSSISPQPPPPGILTEKQFLYMKHAVGMGEHTPGLVVDMVNLNNNTFTVNNSTMLINIIWETNDTTFVALHPHCATILRHHLGYTTNSPEHLIELSLLDKIVGPTMGGVHAGRFKDINYEGILGKGDKNRVDIESFWSKDGNECPGFDWLGWQRRGLDWTAARPDVFPRFRPQVAPTRISSLGLIPQSTEDIITTQPLDVLHVLLPYLDPKSFVNLLSTCRTLRHHALTTFQPQARTQVLKLGWAVPTEVEYASFVRRNPPPPAATSPTSSSTETSPPSCDKPSEADAASATPRPETSDTPPEPAKDQPDFSLVTMAHAAHSPADADWYLYLSQVHRSQGMRARRWVWALAEEVTRVYHKKRAAGPYAPVVDADGKETKSPKWKAYAQHVQQPLMMRPFMTGAVGPAKGGAKRFTW
ncbi:hypothetical protein L226DRAFT_534915 [Lentinus tigrinus ALCF2SS1-7]|uniref:F-box domain-containing protein n=1 Tax=Lentinus tigrinus ALCF2SS1-6 TaxID=1328759 RepID=A0A5C2S878_9APHY|nr:hypothetical protein L227DRAFT_575507 [Lentinus tigrinus ALCF2SS1-6]RPD74695.1 hypothetical protein L226DRAFT_534915 [Lentinus tigrinus ALCF2SS1-7]